MSERAPGSRLLQQFARFPRRGQVKTRLARRVGEASAYEVHTELVAQTAATLVRSGVAPPELWLDQLGRHALIERILHSGMAGPNRQEGADLGARMLSALQSGLERAESVVLVGSDCPGLSAAYLEEAFQHLETHDLVLGPAEDGGYVLIGARKLAPEVFQRVPWGEGTVLAATERNAQAVDLRVARLAPRYDVDEWEDLQRWRAEQTLDRVRDGAAAQV